MNKEEILRHQSLIESEMNELEEELRLLDRDWDDLQDQLEKLEEQNNG